MNVIAVFGMSYSGSTLLNFMLDCVDGVYGGGELHWLRTQHNDNCNYVAHCTNCKDECPIWTPNACQKAPHDDFYTFVGKQVNSSVIVDTSKTIGWFSQRKTFDTNVNLHNFLLTKHPIRHLASFVVNQKLDSESDSSQTIDKAIDAYTQYYDETLEYLSRRDYQIVHYEDLILRNLETINNILASVGLSIDKDVLDCFKQPHHQIAGNGAAIYMATQKWPSSRQNQPPKKLAQYESKSGVFLDNKYQQVLDEGQIERICSDPRIVKVATILNYELTAVA
ncbi:hypothetical protein [Alteromonas flava]|uniref:hypothetical protein n=1 Tax=Alteromonas flava TaxID=2048003 RepID=UPI000C28CC48|nr:hypothetical protein [Alteromonas flava]